MSVREQELGEIVDAIWTEMLQLPVRPSFEPWHPGGGRGWLTGRVDLCGAWVGTVSVDCPRELARRLAGTMFQLDADRIGRVDLEDAIGELANITGGNVKALLPGPSTLSLPAVSDADGPVPERPDRPLVARAAFECEGQPFWVIVRGRRAAG